MPAAVRKGIRLMPVNNKPNHKNHLGNKPIPWVDVGDDDDSLSKKSLKRKNAMLNGHDTSRKHKRPRPSHSSETSSSPDLPNGHNPNVDEGKTHKRRALNGAGPSTHSAKAAALLEQRKQLPIAQGRDALMDEIRANDVTVLLGETGSGKTTQVPQYLLEHGLASAGTIAVTQPRKVAATSLASRVSTEQNSPLGHLVGYSVRFDEKSSNDTRIKYMTDGMIVRELLSDPLLSKYSVIIVDEAHERTLRTDLLMANLKKIQKQRNVGGEQGKGKGKSNPLKIVVMSATLDAEKFSKFFDNAKILYIKGRQHPVKIYHSAEPQPDYIDSAMRTFFQIHTDQPPGDVLIFLPGQEDIESLEKSIELYANRLPQSAQGVFICAMYAAQAPGKNAKVFSPTPKDMRKCILATNIAETSITIPGVKYVIDTGKCKEKRYLAKDSGGGKLLLIHSPAYE
ncbi:P-loop containing nucleoside triphosphate hydrolase protein [Cyathus striatus]|nr:P-loop containing nucleoside triphosphate hydrolase protein [Cyathus striatus]